MTGLTLLTRGVITPGYNPAVTAVTWGVLFFRNPNIVIGEDYVPLFIVGPQPKPGLFIGLSKDAVVNGGHLSPLIARQDIDFTAKSTSPFINPEEKLIAQASSYFAEPQKIEFIDPEPRLVDVKSDVPKLIPKLDPDFIDNDN